MKTKAEYNIEKRAARMPKPPPRPSSSSSSASSLPFPPPTKNSSRGVPLPPPWLPSSRPPSIRPSKLPRPPPPDETSIPPVPPPPSLGPGGAFRLRELVELYHSLMRRQGKREIGDMIEEMESKSSFLLAVRADVETQGDFVQSLAAQVRGASFTDIQHLVSFVKWLDKQLAFLVDEQAVLRHFDWPEGKTDALRQAAFDYGFLMRLEKKVSSFVDHPHLPCDQALKKMHSLHERMEKGIDTFLQKRHRQISLYKEFGIPIDWLLDSGTVAKIKLASVELARKYMKRAASELDSLSEPKKERKREFLILQGVRFAFRIHQFAGGFDAKSMLAFKELKGHIQSEIKQEYSEGTDSWYQGEINETHTSIQHRQEELKPAK